MTDQTRTDIAAAIARLTGEREEGEDILRLAVIGIGNVLHRHHRKGGDWEEMLSSREDEFRHVVDWIASALADGDEWLSRTDDKGRPLKLAKMNSVEQLVAEADKAFGKKLQKIGNTVVLPDDERLEMELGDGYRVVRMLSPAALDRESDMMQHCVGLGSYDRILGGNERALYSLRDAFNKPHATMEVFVKDRVLAQLKGKQNAMPNLRYLRLLGPFLKTMDFDTGEMADRGFVIDSAGIVYHMSDIPDGSSFATSLRFAGVYDEDRRIPSGISVEGNLRVSQAYEEILRVPAKIGGNVSAAGIEIEGFHDDFTFTGGLNLANSTVSGFPARHFGGDVNLMKTKGVQLQPGTVIDGNLNISLSDIRELPSDLVVKGDLVATGSALERLPEGLTIGGSAYLSSTRSILEIADGVRIGGNLLLRDSSVRAIGGGVTVGGMISLDSREAIQLRIEPDLAAGSGFFLRDTDNSPALRTQMSVEEFIAATSPDLSADMAPGPMAARR